MVKHIILWQLKEMDEEEKADGEEGDQGWIGKPSGKNSGTFVDSCADGRSAIVKCRYHVRQFV